ncbi:hypothetical protein LKL35_36910, partial [Streptomyces sp. ET3-23]|nr:hypothetical protein [Streptomyces sp. ET3-23]
MASQKSDKNQTPFARRTLSFAPGGRAPAQGNLDYTTPEQGVYLHWQVPAALQAQRHDARNSDPQPWMLTAPDRWLVLRHHRTGASGTDVKASGWLVESTFLDANTNDEENEASSPYIRYDEQKKAWQKCRIGRRILLSEKDGWKAPKKADFKLTTALPGVPEFSAYQPYCEDVFSLKDPVGEDDTADPYPETEGKDALAEAELNYLVIGWHSDAQDNPLRTETVAKLLDFHGYTVHDHTAAGDAENLRQALDILGWDAPGLPTAATDVRPVYVGHVLGMYWKKDKAEEPAAASSRPADTSRLPVSVAHTSADALDALLEECSFSKTGTLEERNSRRELITAFHSGLLETLDRALDDGSEALRQALHARWFQPLPAGIQWQAAALPSADGAKNPPQTTPAVRAALVRLNTAQRAYDEAARAAADQQRHRDAARWAADEHFFEPLQGDYTKELQAAKDALTAAQSALDKAAQTLKALDAAREDAKKAAAEALKPHWTLKCLPADPFYRPADPVTLLLRPGTDAVSAPSRLSCRTQNALCSKASLGGKDLTPVSPAASSSFTTNFGLLRGYFGTTGDASVLDLLIKEFQYLVAADLGTQGQTEPRFKDLKAVQGTLPTGLRPWRQPWTPFMLSWSTQYYPVEAADAHGQPTGYWKMADGAYKLQLPQDATKLADTRKKFNDEKVDVTGDAILSPTPVFTLQKRIESYLDSYRPDSSDTKKALKELREDVMDWDLLTQSLNGTSAALSGYRPAVHDYSSFCTPQAPPSLADVPDPVKKRRFATLSGQFAFTRLLVTDTFGQSFDVIGREGQESRADSFAPRTGRGTKPDDSAAPAENSKNCVSDENTHRFVTMPPRLARPARLRHEFLSHASSTARIIDVHSDPSAQDDTAICAWILPRARGRAPQHHTLGLYLPGGKGLGELTLAGPSGREFAALTPLPDSPYATLTALAKDHPHLAGFLGKHLDLPTGSLLDGAVPGPARTAQADRLAGLIDAINASVPRMAPPSEDRQALLQLLAGRPLALIRMQMRIELDGTSPFFWPQPADSAPVPSPWPLDLGSATDIRDGLIGYYLSATSDSQEIDYAHLYVPFTPQHPAYLVRARDGLATVDGKPRTIAVPAAGTGGSACLQLTLLADPFLPVHAVTDILPRTALSLPHETVSTELASLPVQLAQGPVLIPPPFGTSPDLVLPLPFTKGTAGHHSTWRERTPSGWHTPQPATNNDTQAHTEYARPQAHTGYLDPMPPAPRNS